MNNIDMRIEEAFDYIHNDTQKAVDIFDEILEIEPENIEAINGKGSSMMKLNQMNEAEKFFDYSLSITVNPTALMNKGLICKNKKEFDKALSYYDKAIQLNPNLNNVITILKNEVLELMDEYAEIDLTKFSPNAHKLIKQGMCYKNSNHLWDALDCYQRAVFEDVECKNSIKALINEIKTILQSEFLLESPELGNSRIDQLKLKALRMLLIEENPKQALTIMNIILENDENEIDTLNHKGTILFFFDKCEESLLCFDKCLNINENYFYALFNKGIVLRRINKLKEALICFDKLLEMPQYYNKVKPYQLEILDKLHEKGLDNLYLT